jgi:hypothetical protein
MERRLGGAGTSRKRLLFIEYPVNMPHGSGPDEGETSKRESLNIWQPAGLKGNPLRKRSAGSYFTTFAANGITIGLQNP